MKKIEVYGHQMCAPCRELEAYLKQKGIEYIKHDVIEDEEAAYRLQNEIGSNSVPTVVVDGTDVLVGFDKSRLDDLLR